MARGTEAEEEIQEMKYPKPLEIKSWAEPT